MQMEELWYCRSFQPPEAVEVKHPTAGNIAVLQCVSVNMQIQTYVEN
jgi:hypothetical protein